MKDYPYVPGWRLNKQNNKPAIKHSILMLTTHGVAEGEWDGNEWIQYRWSCKIKDSDVLYWIHLEDLTRLEKEGDSLQQEQPEVALEKEIDVCWKNWLSPSNQKDVEGVLPKTEFAMYARHFFELGRSASKAIWHNVAEEIPTEIGAEVIVACKNKNKECGIWLYDLIQCWEGEWKPRVNWETPIRWAYVRDLDSARKEK